MEYHGNHDQCASDTFNYGQNSMCQKKIKF